MTEIKYIVHILNVKRLKLDDEKIRAIVEQPPTDKQEMLDFMGIAQYLDKFISNLCEISAPLRKLLEKDTEWEKEWYWEETRR